VKLFHDVEKIVEWKKNHSIVKYFYGNKIFEGGCRRVCRISCIIIVDVWEFLQIRRTLWMASISVYVINNKWYRNDSTNSYLRRKLFFAYFMLKHFLMRLFFISSKAFHNFQKKDLIHCIVFPFLKIKSTIRESRASLMSF
jgi:hypothetical protein